MDKPTSAYLKTVVYPECCVMCYGFEHFGKEACKEQCPEKGADSGFMPNKPIQRTGRTASDPNVNWRTKMDKLTLLLAKCRCGVFLSVNEHRDYYETVERTLAEASHNECPPQISDEVRQAMIKTNTIIKLLFYPDTPISSYEVWHYDLNAALDEALACLDS